MLFKNFTDLSKAERDMVLSWRNDAGVRAYMYTSRVITPHEHAAFIEQLREDATKRYFLLYEADTPIGVIDFTQITAQGAAIGLYAKPHAHGLGTKLMEAILSYAASQGWQTLNAEVLSCNERAQKLYARFGFEAREKSRYKDQEILMMERHL